MRRGGPYPMSQSTNREIHLASRPTGVPEPENFKLVETPMPKTGQGQFLVRNILMSVDPYMRGRMTDRESYIPPYQVGQVLDGGSVGQVVDSQHAGFAAGDYVCGFATGGWREYWVSDGTMMQKVDPSLAPLQAYLGVLGLPGTHGLLGLSPDRAAERGRDGLRIGSSRRRWRGRLSDCQA